MTILDFVILGLFFWLMCLYYVALGALTLTFFDGREHCAMDRITVVLVLILWPFAAVWLWVLGKQKGEG
jgi:hypothetical protein